MKITNETAALVTGAGTGLGRAIALALGKAGARITVAEISDEKGRETVQLLQEQSEVGEGLAAVFVKCDVSIPGQLANAFGVHMQTFGRLDICVNNAGIGETQYFLSDGTPKGEGIWRKLLEINLTAVVDGTRLAAQLMQKQGTKGVVVNVASAAGLYPSPNGPVYAASKGGVVMFTRSVANLVKSGVRVSAICPEFVRTDLVTKGLAIDAGHMAKQVNAVGGFIPMEQITDGVLELISDDSKAGECLWITRRHGKQYWPFSADKSMWSATSKKQSAQGLPTEFKKIIIHSLSTNFRASSKIVTVPLRLPVGKGKVLIRYLYSAINASDVNFSAGRYFGSKQAAEKKLPFDAGFDAVGVVAALGEGVNARELRAGRPVATMLYGGFAEFAEVDARMALPVQSASPETLAMLTSGLTASIGLEQAGRMSSGETVLVTAAAGGTGQFAVQLAVLAGNKVIATCGGSKKAALLKSLGVHRVIDYHAEDVQSVLKSEFPKGVDVIYESVGGRMFETCLNALAQHGRLVIIGMMSQYTSGESNEWKQSQISGLAEKLLWRSQTLSGMFLPQYAVHFKRHLQRLENLYSSGKLTVAIDPTLFKGVESVADAVEHLQSGKSIGKVVVHVGGGTTVGSAKL